MRPGLLKGSSGTGAASCGSGGAGARRRKANVTLPPSPRANSSARDPDTRECIAEVLQEAGHEPREAVDGLDAWQMLHDGETLPDVIVLDLMMPRMDGATFRARQSQELRLASIPTIVLAVLRIDPPLRSSARGASP